MQDNQPTLPPLKEAVGAEAYDHRPRYNMAIRTTSLGAPAWNAGYESAQPNHTQQRPGACATPIQAINTNVDCQHSPYLHGNVPYSRQPSLSTSSVNLSAAESVDGYCTSPATTSCSSETFGKSSSRKRAQTKKARRDGQTQNPTKNRKEQQHRHDLGGLIRKMQDILMNYCGTVVGSTQMTGNKKSSGLLFTKVDTLKNFIAVCLQLMDRAYKHALENDALSQFQEEMVQIQKEHREPTNPEHDPAYNTLMRGTAAPCSHGDNEICAKHGKLDWALCRTKFVADGFKGNEKIFRARL